MRRLSVALLLAAALLLALPAAAYATGGDLYAAGTVYGASTYSGHASAFGTTPDAWIVDINAVGGDLGRAIFAPEDGTVSVFSTGYGRGYGNSIIWTSADGREQIHMAHLSAIGKTGAVKAGDLIGRAGDTGQSTSDHLHVSRTYDGKPAPVVLSGREVVPGWSGNGNQYTSAGWVGASLTLAGPVDGMTYYGPVTVTYGCAEADAGTLAADIDGTPVASGTQIAQLGTHRFTVRACVRGSSVTRSVTFTVGLPPAAGLEPVFRFYNAAKGTHFFTPAVAERDNVVTTLSGTFAFEGVAYWLDFAKNPQPLYRFYNVRNGSHFYTASAEERDMVIARYPTVYSYEGETYRVSATPVEGATAVYRFYNLKNGSHFFTASAGERDNVIAQMPSLYRYEGAAFWLVQ